MKYRHEMVIPNDDIPFRMFVFEGKDGNYRVIQHWHQSVEIFLVQRGFIDFFVDTRRFHLKTGDFVIVNSNEIHSIEAPEENYTIVLQIPADVFKDYMQQDPYAVFARKEKQINDQLAGLVLEMFRIYQKKEFGYELKVQSQYFQLLHLMVTGFLSANINEESRQQRQYLAYLSHITDFILDNYDQDLSLDLIAKKFGYSTTYLSRMFKKYTSINYKTYLLNLRTAFGLKELIHSNKTISNIALNNGFPNSKAFTKAFVKRYGCTPSQYRKKLKES